MKKILAMGSLLLSSAGVLVTPAAARDFDRYDYRTPAYTYQARVDHNRAERLRLDRLRRLRERERELQRRQAMLRHNIWNRY